jgi:hypothetical protein
VYPVCHYCHGAYTDANPPTIDHVVPKSHGGTLNDGWVLACSRCNANRANALYEDYLAACVAEHAAAERERRPYKRPKAYNAPSGAIEISTESRAQRRRRLAASRAATSQSAPSSAAPNQTT